MMDDLAQDASTEDRPIEMDDKTTDAIGSNGSSFIGDLAVDMNDIEPVIDDCGLMEESDNGQKDGSVHNECADVSSDQCLSHLDSIQQNECDVVQDDAHSQNLKLDTDQDLKLDTDQDKLDTDQDLKLDTDQDLKLDTDQDLKLDSDSAPCSGPVKSPDTGVDGDLLLLTLEGSSDKQDVLINELQNKEKIISDLRIRVAELEAQLGIMPNMKSCTKRPPSRFIDHMTPSLKRARARSSTPSRRISVHLKSLKRARLRSPLCLGSGAESADMISQSSILSPEDMDVLAVEVSHRLSSNLVADITAQVLQQVLPLMDLHADAENENNHIGEDISAASTSTESFSADHNTNSTTAVQSGSSSSGAKDDGSSSKSSIPRPNNIKVHIPNIFRQRHVRPQANLPRHVPQMPVRHPVGMSGSNQFGMNMQRMPMPGNMGSPSPNALMMQQLMNTPAGAQAAQALSHLNQMNRLAALQAQQRGTRPQLQNARFSPQVSPLMSPRANSAGAGINMGQARNIAMNAAFRRAMSSRVLTGQGLNMNNR